MFFGNLSNEAVIACATKGTDRVYKNACREAERRNLFIEEAARAKTVKNPNPKLAMEDKIIMELYHSGDEAFIQESKDQVLLRYGKYVGHLIHHCFPTFEVEHNNDLYDCGCIGLIKAMKNYKYSKDCKFMTYSKNYIIHEMTDYTNFLTRQPSKHFARLQVEVRRAHDTLKSSGIMPTAENIAEMVDVKVSTVKRELDVMNNMNLVYMDGVESQDALNLNAKSTTDDIDERLDKEKLLSVVLGAIDTLDEDTKKIIIMHGANKIEYAKIASEIGIEQSRVKSMYKKGIETVRRMSRKYALGA